MMVIDHKEVIDIIGETELKVLKALDSEYTKRIISLFSQNLIERFEGYAEIEMNDIAKKELKP